MTEAIRQLGRYELLRRIAVGGMGEIFLARMRGAAGFEKRVIIKTILPHLAEEQEFVTKFLDEGRIVVQLTHGNIVPVFDMGEEDNEYFIAMEYIPGRDLREVLKRLHVEARLLPISMCVHMIVETCKGLGYAHRKVGDDGEELNIVHRDVSPSNILISHEGEVKVIDFGIARATSRASQTVSGRIQGKFNYMSPEQASGKIVDERSDVFSTGVVLYEMLTGIRPFQGDTDLETLDLVRKCDFDPPSVFNPKIPQELDDIVQRALEKNLSDRYQNMDQMQGDLLRFLYTAGNAPSSRALTTFLSELFPDGVERRELKFNTSSKSASQKKISLEDAMDMELDRLLGGTPDIDPLTATAASSPAQQPHTATLLPTPSHELVDATHQPSSEDPDPAPKLTAPEDTNDTQDDAQDDPQEKPQSEPRDESPAKTPSTPDEPNNNPNPTPTIEEPSGPITAQTDIHFLQMKGAKRAVIIVAILLTIAVAAGIIGANVWEERRVGMLLIQSNPPGAHIYVDGARLSEVTPATIELKAGSHNIELRKAGYQHTDKFKVRVKNGKTISLREEPITLLAKTAPQKARRFSITSTPVGAMVKWQIKNQETQSGVTPLLLELKPGQFANLTVSREHCQPSAMPITFDAPKRDIHFELKCQAPSALKTPDMTAPTNDTKSTPKNTIKRTKSKRFVVHTIPPRADLKLKGSQGQLKSGASPQQWVLPQKSILTVTASKTGYETVTKSYRVAALTGKGVTITLPTKPMGCLTFKAGYPQVNEYILDGKNLGKRTGLKNHPLSAGPHELVVRNKTINKSERFRFKIDSSKKCYRQFVWPIPH